MQRPAWCRREKVIVMRSVLRSGFLWQLFGGFVLGTLALVTFHPTESAHTTADSPIAAQR